MKQWLVASCSLVLAYEFGFGQDLRFWAGGVPAHAQKPIFGRQAALLNRTHKYRPDSNVTLWIWIGIDGHDI